MEPRRFRGTRRLERVGQTVDDDCGRDTGREDSSSHQAIIRSSPITAQEREDQSSSQASSYSRTGSFSRP